MKKQSEEVYKRSLSNTLITIGLFLQKTSYMLTQATGDWLENGIPCITNPEHLVFSDVRLM